MITALRSALVIALGVALLHALSAAQADDDACHARCVAHDYDRGAQLRDRCVCSSDLPEGVALR